jgi:hypothetical protein
MLGIKKKSHQVQDFSAKAARFLEEAECELENLFAFTVERNGVI